MLRLPAIHRQRHLLSRGGQPLVKSLPDAGCAGTLQVVTAGTE